MNHRGIEPGTIDTNYRPTVGAQSPESNHRGLEPGLDGRDKAEVAAGPPPLPPMPEVFDLEKAALIRRTGRIYCPISGCEYVGSAESGLRGHLSQKHPQLSVSTLILEVRTLLAEHAHLKAKATA